MDKFTPGPWKIEPIAAALSPQQQDYLITYSDGELRSHVARLFDNCLCDEHGTTSANARLIAAAPELYEALKRLLAVFDSNNKWAIDSEVEQSRATLAKVKP